MRFIILHGIWCFKANHLRFIYCVILVISVRPLPCFFFFSNLCTSFTVSFIYLSISLTVSFNYRCIFSTVSFCYHCISSTVSFTYPCISSAASVDYFALMCYSFFFFWCLPLLLAPSSFAVILRFSKLLTYYVPCPVNLVHPVTSPCPLTLNDISAALRELFSHLLALRISFACL